VPERTGAPAGVRIDVESVSHRVGRGRPDRSGQRGRQTLRNIPLTVRYDGVDRHANPGAFRSSLGYVPQDDIIHRQLPLARTLRHAARLRLAGIAVELLTGPRVFSSTSRPRASTRRPAGPGVRRGGGDPRRRLRPWRTRRHCVPGGAAAPCSAGRGGTVAYWNMCPCLRR
jgi:hypothetical protein